MGPGRHLDSRRPSSCCGDPVASRLSVTRFSVPTPDFPHADGSARSPDDDVTAPQARAQVVVAPMDFVRLCDYERGADVPPLPVGALGRTTVRVLVHVHLPRPLVLAAFQLTRHSASAGPGATGSTARPGAAVGVFEHNERARPRVPCVTRLAARACGPARLTCALANRPAAHCPSVALARLSTCRVQTHATRRLAPTRLQLGRQVV